MKSQVQKRGLSKIDFKVILTERSLKIITAREIIQTSERSTECKEKRTGNGKLENINHSRE